MNANNRVLHPGRRLNISAENDCRRLHCSLRDLSSLLQAVGRLAEHFIGEVFAARFSDAVAVVERSVTWYESDLYFLGDKKLHIACFRLMCGDSSVWWVCVCQVGESDVLWFPDQPLWPGDRRAFCAEARPHRCVSIEG